MNETTDIAHLIQAAIAPVFLLSGVAAMLGVLTNRLARIVDRARALEDRLEAQPEALPRLLDDLKVLARRARYINVGDLPVHHRRAAGGAGGGHPVRQRLPGRAAHP